MRCLTLALAATLLAAPAVADQLPNLIPTHDVSGTYTITGQSGAKTVAVEYSKSANVLRLTLQSGAGYILYDFTTKDAKMVMPQMQRYMDRPEMAQRAAALQGKADGDNVTITKGATETIAGHDCTDYTATDTTKNTSSTFCVTDDGVLLKISSDRGSAVAQSVSYNSVPVADVEIPPGYTQFVMPQIPGMSGMAPNAMGGMSGMGNMPMPGTPSQ